MCVAGRLLAVVCCLFVSDCRVLVAVCGVFCIGRRWLVFGVLRVMDCALCDACCLVLLAVCCLLVDISSALCAVRCAMSGVRSLMCVACLSRVCCALCVACLPVVVWCLLLAGVVCWL